MTENKALKRRIRERMTKTGESYSSARSKTVAKRDRTTAAKARLAAPDDRPSEAAVKDATGKTWDEWFDLLDRWGGATKKHGEIARHVADLGVPGWWAQSVTVAYERARGMRLKYQRPDGFSVSASKTINVPLESLYDAFLDEDRRSEWLGDGSLSLRTAQPGRSARFDWGDGTTRLVVGFTAKGDSKSMVALAHERLADADDAETMKEAWKGHLARLKKMLET